VQRLFFFLFSGSDSEFRESQKPHCLKNIPFYLALDPAF